jgi:CO/xanthine dehydrogenase Mo-binding subunit
MDPIDFRIKNAAKEGTKASYGRSTAIGFVETLEAAKNHPHYKAPLGPTRAAAWPRASGSTSAASPARRSQHHRGRHGRSCRSGIPDIGGSRASMAMMAAEELGIDYDQVRCDHRRHQPRSASTT